MNSPAIALPRTFRFATQSGNGSTEVFLPLPDGFQFPARLRVLAGNEAVTLPTAAPSGFVLVSVTQSASSEDDEHEFEILQTGSESPILRASLRRTRCVINTALIERHWGDPPLRPQTKAALLWYAWRRYDQLVGLKRYTSGRGGSDVLMFRPKLRDPIGTEKIEPVVSGAMSQSWGSCLLIKTGKDHKIQEEFDRFKTYLVDRLHPFMSRSEEILDVCLLPIGEVDSRARLIPEATLVGSFLGGDLLHAESLEQILKGSEPPERCLAVLEKVFSVLRTWYMGSTVRPLRDWYKVFRIIKNDEPLTLFGKFDLADPSDRERFRAPLAWDVAFIQEAHLRDHLLGEGEKRNGLLYRLMDMEVRFSLVHGDLHARNVLAGNDGIWLIDFGETCVAPTLFDFAKLEVYLRLWCLNLSTKVRDLAQASHRFESELLDLMTGAEAGIGDLDELASHMGADSGQLRNLVRYITQIRRYAAEYTGGSPDRRDYIAVLYLTVLDALRFTGTDPALSENYRMLVSLAWVVEDVLSRIVGMTPYPRKREPMAARRLVTRTWIAAPGLVGRVQYLMQSGEDRLALEWLDATRGVMQNDHHHLDVFGHTMLALSYVERLLEDPVAGLVDPGALDRVVRDDMRRHGIPQPDYSNPIKEGDGPDLGGTEDHLAAVRAYLQTELTNEMKEALKWGVLFHDVGKPATRVVHVNGGEARVGFLGHEVYGLQLVRDQLRAWLGIKGDAVAKGKEEAERKKEDVETAVHYLITRHHDHHTRLANYLLTWFGQPESDKKSAADRIRALYKVLATRAAEKREWAFLSDLMDSEKTQTAKFFPILIIHGYADMLACRGPSSNVALSDVARLDLLLLALATVFPELKRRHLAEQEFAERTKGWDQWLGVTGRVLGDVLKEVRRWYIQERLQRAGSSPITDAELEAVARKVLEDKGNTESIRS